MKSLSTLLAAAAIFLCLILFYKLDKLSGSNSDSNAEVKNITEEPVQEVDVVGAMGKLQIFANKMYFAGKNENKALYQFYLNEMREVMTEVEAGNAVMNGVDVSSNMKSFGLPSLMVIENRIGEEGFKNFNDHYTNLITACNSCHKVSKRGFLEITVPKTPIFDNQTYTKGEFSDMLVDTDGD